MSLCSHSLRTADILFNILFMALEVHSHNLLKLDTSNDTRSWNDYYITELSKVEAHTVWEWPRHTNLQLFLPLACYISGLSDIYF